MKKKDVNELKRRFTKEKCTISRMASCYVDWEKNKILTSNEQFLTLDDDEFFKYLEIAKKAFSGSVGNNILTLQIPNETEEKTDGMYRLLLSLRETGLKDDNLLDTFYDRVIETFEYSGNYLITVFFDAYDVPVKTTDEMLLGDSEEVFSYIVCCICPVGLSKAALGYREDENRIGSLIRDWVVGATDTAFMFPAFNDRSSDVHEIMVYSKDAKEPHREFWENGLECPGKLTSTQKRRAFSDIVTKNVGADEPRIDEIITDVQESIMSKVTEAEEFSGESDDEDDGFIFKKEELTGLLQESGIDEKKSEHIADEYETVFSDEKPLAKELIDSRVLKNAPEIEEKRSLKNMVVTLSKELFDAGVKDSDGSDIDIVLRVSPDMVDTIDTTFVNGVRCLVIPIPDGGASKASINGEIQEL